MHICCRTFVLAACLGSSALLTPVNARADDRGPTWEVVWQLDVPVLVLEGSLAIAWTLGDQLAPPYCAPQCDGDDLWTIDRISAGRWQPGWAMFSDVAAGVTVGGSFVALAIDEGVPNALVDGVIVLEAVGAASALGVVMQFATRRPRPFLYGDDAPLKERMRGRAALSFWSGHTANAFAAVTAVFVTGRTRDPHASWPYFWLGGGYVAATLIGTGRVLSGHHFLTDTLTGAAAGIALGWLVPSLHASGMRPALSTASNGATLGFSADW